MTAIKKLIDGGGNQYFPQTHTKAVVDDNGYSVESRMQAVQDLVNQAQLAIGSVPSDLAPTKDSTNWVTSGGIYNSTPSISNNVSCDFDIKDEQGVQLAIFENGHFKTKNFDSSVAAVCEDNSISDLSINDDNGNCLVQFSDGHIKTKNFDSSNLEQTIVDVKTKVAENNYAVRFSDFKNSSNTDDEAVADMMSYSSIFPKRTIIIDRDITISKAILLQSNTTVIIEGVSITQADYSFDNVFRGANIPWSYGDGEEAFLSAQDKTQYKSYLLQVPSDIDALSNIAIVGYNDASIIGCANNATILYNGSTTSLIGDYFGARTHQINLCRCNDVKISGINLSRTRGWAICFDICHNITISDVTINSNVKNGDGIDFRYGCKNINITNIKGSTSDDLVACTCIPPSSHAPQDGTGTYMFNSELSVIYSSNLNEEDYYIENVNVNGVKYMGDNAYSTGGHGLILLASNGGRVENVCIDSFTEMRGGDTKEAVVKIYTGYGSGYTDGDLNSIRVNSLTCTNSSYAVMSNCKCEDVWINAVSSETQIASIAYNDGFKITNLNI